MVEYDNFFLLEGLSQTDKQEIIDGFSEPIKFSRGETIYSEKHFSNAIGYIIRGTACALTNNGSGVVMKRFSGGMSFGVAALFGEEKSYVSTVCAEKDCVIQFVSEDALREIFSKYPMTAVNYITFLSDKIRFLNQKLGIISCISAEDTLFKFLSDSADEDGNVMLPNNMSLLARSIGLGRSSLYRALESLETSGKIIREKNKVKVKKL